MHWNKKLLKNLNISIPLTVFLLIVIGLVAISSAVEINKPHSYGMRFLQKQIIAVILGVIAVLVIQFYDYRMFKDYMDIIYLTSVGILVVLLIAGETIAGGKMWISLGPVNFQPSELSKIMVILVLATVLDEEQKNLEYLTGMAKPFLYVLIPFVLIILQNDLGTSLVFLFIFIGMLFVAGGNLFYMVLFFGGGFLSIVLYIIAHFKFNVPLIFLKEYQLNRLVAFVNPDLDPYNIGYNLNQSKIAIGSGKLFGKGLFAGTQNQLKFLPEKHTDFIISVIGEEFGFIGILILVSLYIFLLWQIFNVAIEAKDNYGRLVVTGIGCMFFFHIIENIGMAMGLMPITGLPLPFISYGGSFMVSSLVAIGLVINVNLRKSKILF
ncbi:rod shape-determining protein RodA [Halothermothrix orenii]|uniref:Cell cycle protein n=1 Tax=Halothermothrix orenii (strain H 168 / OCM 544 / DSM 9562) TaxID=373903 RepID=B8CXZ7_HALOH|nr:rod shape-determining protein RodA [Halothermothrix orenii]ACL70166.1 cell cycle protein [Halothermothrix orenii H 168]